MERRDEGVAQLNEHWNVRHGADAFAGHGGHQAAGGVAERLQVAQWTQLLAVSEGHQGNVNVFALCHRQGAGDVVGRRRPAGDDQNDVTRRRFTATLQHLRNQRQNTVKRVSRLS